jgi:hypothetical protein
MKEKPIIFSTPMVQALLNTKPGSWPAEPLDPSKPFKRMTRRPVKPQPKYPICKKNGRWHEYSEQPAADRICNSPWGHGYLCPYTAGQVLWVRETFTKDPNGEYIYRADPMFDDCGKDDISWTWTSPLFLPREAARLFLEVKDVRLERLAQITGEEVIAEGTNDFFCFRYLWDTINAKRGYGWYENPWVWVIEFMRAA